MPLDRDLLAASVRASLGDPAGIHPLHVAARRLADRHDVDLHTILRAAEGRPVNFAKLVALCHALGLDPATQGQAGSDMPECRGPFAWPFFAVAVGVWHRARGKSLRKAGKLAGLSYSTVRRAMRGQAIEDASVLRLYAAMGMHPHEHTMTPEGLAFVTDAEAAGAKARQGRARFTGEADVSRANVSRGTSGETLSADAKSGRAEVVQTVSGEVT